MTVAALALLSTTVPAVPARASANTPVFDPAACTNSGHYGGWFYHDLRAGDDRYDADDPAIRGPIEAGFESQRRFRIPQNTSESITQNDRVAWAGIGLRPPLRYRLVTPPAHASFFSLSPEGDVEYVGDAHAWGPDSFRYVIEVGGVCSNIATVTFGESARPRMVHAEFTVRAGQTLRSPLVCSATGCGVMRNDLLGPYEITQLRPRPDGDGLDAAVDAGEELKTTHGRVTVQPGGHFVYEPDPDFTGEDVFYYAGAKIVRHSTGRTATYGAWSAYGDLGKVTVQVLPPPEPTTPIARHDGPFDVEAGSSRTLTPWQLRANDDNVAHIAVIDGQSMVGNSASTRTLNTPNGRLVVTIGGPGCGGGLGGYCPAAHPTSLQYIPAPGFVGIDGFSYRGTGSGGGLTDAVNVELHVRGDQDLPFASHVHTETNEGTPLHLDLSVAASDPFRGIDVSSIREAPCDHEDCARHRNGDWEFHGDGTVTFTPDRGYVGAARTEWLVDNRDGDTTGAEVVVDVRWHPSVDDAYTAAEETLLEVPAPGVLANDRTADTQVALVRDVAHGHLTLQPDGSFTYEPGADHPGRDSFVYVGYEGDTATVSITVEPVNRAPQVELNARACDHADDTSCTDPTDPDQRTTDDQPIRLRGSIDDRERDEGVLRVDWGDGSTISLAYPCFDDACDDLVTMEPTWDEACDDACDGRLFFDLSHHYDAAPPDDATVHTIEVVATDVHGAVSVPTSTFAVVRGERTDGDDGGDDDSGDDDRDDDSGDDDGGGDDDSDGDSGDDSDQEPDGCRPTDFRDVSADHAHAAAIDRIARACIASGYPDGTYRPGRPVSRGQVATLLASALQLPPGTAHYPDVPSHHPHARGISALDGIGRGFEDGTFRPEAPVSRAQFATLLRNALQLPEGTATFPDVAAESLHADAIAAVAATGIRGFEDGTYRPQAAVTRGQMATFLVRTILDRE